VTAFTSTGCTKGAQFGSTGAAPVIEVKRMPAPALVAYCTRTGSTRDVAETIAEVLVEAQIPV